MNRTRLLSKPHWRHFDHVPGLAALPLVALACMDSFLDHVAAHGLADPQSDDVVTWASAEDDPAAAVEHLVDALRVCVPAFVGAAESAAADVARQRRRRTRQQPEQAPAASVTPGQSHRSSEIAGTHSPDPRSAMRGGEMSRSIPMNCRLRGRRALCGPLAGCRAAGFASPPRS